MCHTFPDKMKEVLKDESVLFRTRV